MHGHASVLRVVLPLEWEHICRDPTRGNTAYLHCGRDNFPLWYAVCERRSWRGRAPSCPPRTLVSPQLAHLSLTMPWARFPLRPDKKLFPALAVLAVRTIRFSEMLRGPLPECRPRAARGSQTLQLSRLGLSVDAPRYEAPGPGRPQMPHLLMETSRSVASAI